MLLTWLTLAKRADLEQLMAYGVSPVSTPHAANSPEPSQMQIEDVAPVLSKRSVMTDVMSVDEDMAALPSTLGGPPESARPLYGPLETPATADMGQDIPPYSYPALQALGNKSVVMSNGTSVSHASNAFEGSLDGLDFCLESF